MELLLAEKKQQIAEDLDAEDHAAEHQPAKEHAAEQRAAAEDLIAESAEVGLKLLHQELCPVSTEHHDILGLVFERV